MAEGLTKSQIVYLIKKYAGDSSNQSIAGSTNPFQNTLYGLNDTDISGLQQDHTLMYDDVNDMWVNGFIKDANIHISAAISWLKMKPLPSNKNVITDQSGFVTTEDRRWGTKVFIRENDDIHVGEDYQYLVAGEMTIDEDEFVCDGELIQLDT